MTYHLEFQGPSTSDFSRIGNDAFRPEYSSRVNPNALRKDVESYLGEYRFEVQKYQYELLFGTSAKGESHLIGVDDREAMVDNAQKAVARRDVEGKNSEREKAELQGLITLEKQLHHAGLGDKIVWMSPPGPKSDGYGDYGFVFLGIVDQINPYTKEKHLSMTAVRVEQPTIDQFNSALTFLTGHEIKFARAEKFLENPVVAANFWDEPENILSYIFSLSTISEKDSLFRKIVPLLRPQIDEFIDLVRQGGPKEFLYRVLQTIELYALDLIKDHSHDRPISLSQIKIPIQQMMLYYQDRNPPTVAGSCGSTGNSSSGLQSSNILNKFSSLSNLFSSSESSCSQCGKDSDNHFHCPDCGYPIPSGKGKETCDGCGLTKQRLADRTGVSCG